MTNVWGDHETNEGWFDYYHNHWEEDLFGDRPSGYAHAVMEVDAEGNLLFDGKPGWRRYRGCINNPKWRTIVTAMASAAIRTGFDGLMVQYPHARGGCACDHCQKAFKAFLSKQYTPEEIREQFGIADLAAHRFETTAPRPGEKTLLDREARAFSAVCVNRFVRRACMLRWVNPDLILSVWAHHRQFLSPDVLFQKEMTNTDYWKLMDERLGLPIDSWGLGESYIWYSTPAYQSDLENRLLGDTSLEHRYLAAMAGDTPFHVSKYDYFRWRAQVGEALANGGIAFGNWKGGWSGGDDRETPHLKSYFKFIRDHDRLLFPREPAGEVALLFMRDALDRGDATWLEPFRRSARAMLDGHINFDVLIDQKLSPKSLRPYRLVVIPDGASLGKAQDAMLSHFRSSGGKVIEVKDEEPAAMDGVIRKAAGDALSTFDAPWTVQVSAHRQPKAERMVVHFVNYNRDESQGRRELPIAAKPVGVDLALRDGEKVAAVRFITPEVDGEQGVDFEQGGTRLRCTTPSFSRLRHAGGRV